MTTMAAAAIASTATRIGSPEATVGTTATAATVAMGGGEWRVAAALSSARSPPVQLPAPPPQKMLMDRYERLSKIGEGSYGQVFKCRDRRDGLIVAIKKFLMSDEDPVIRRIALREIRMLRYLKHPNLVNLLEVFRRNRKLHLVFEFCERTLLEVIESNQRGCPKPLIKCIQYQLLLALNYCHTNQCIHRDVKPENIMLTATNQVKLGDLGFARAINTNDLYTEYVATRWYRSPELLVGDLKYSAAVDVWAAACVLAEMFSGEPLWSGKSDLDQLYLIRQTMGDITQRHAQVFRANHFFRGMSLPEPTKRIELAERLPQCDPKALDFLNVNNSQIFTYFQRCFELDPDMRWSCADLLQHDFLRDYEPPPSVESAAVAAVVAPPPPPPPPASRISSSHLPHLVRSNWESCVKRAPPPPPVLIAQRSFNNIDTGRSYLPTIM